MNSLTKSEKEAAMFQLDQLNAATIKNNTLKTMLNISKLDSLMTKAAEIN